MHSYISIIIQLYQNYFQFTEILYILVVIYIKNLFFPFSCIWTVCEEAEVLKIAVAIGVINLFLKSIKVLQVHVS